MGLQRPRRSQDPKSFDVRFLPQQVQTPYQLIGNEALKRMHSRHGDVGYSPHLQISDRPWVAPVLYSPKSNILGCSERGPQNLVVSGARLDCMDNARYTRMGIRTAPCPSCARMPTLGDASRRGGPSARSRRAGDSARFFDARATPPSYGLDGLSSGATSMLIEFRELPPPPPHEEGAVGGQSSCSRWRVQEWLLPRR